MNVPYMACKTAEMKIIQLQRKESVKKGLSIQTAADESQTQGLLIIKPQQYTGVIQIKNRDQMGWQSPFGKGVEDATIIQEKIKGIMYSKHGV